MTAPVLRRPAWVRAVIVAVVLAVAVTTGGLWWWTHRDGVEFDALFTETVGVYAGSDVRILGVRVGEIDSITPQGTQVKVSMHLDPGVNAAADTQAVIISPNLVSDRYIQLTKVYKGGKKLRSGATIALADTRTPVELDDLYRSLTALTQALGPNGANSDGALNRLLTTAADNLGGNGITINKTIRQFADASSTLSGSRGDIFATVQNLSSFTTMLAQNNESLSTVNRQLASVSTTLANDRQTFAAAMKELASALSLVQRFVHDNRTALSHQVARLSTVAQILVNQRDSIAKVLSTAPLLVQNFINAYDPKNNLLRGRANLNELTLWSGAPPTLLPSADGGSGGGG